MRKPPSPAVEMELEIQIEGLDEEGAGVGRRAGDETAYHVGGVLPGEAVRLAVEHRSPHRRAAWGRLLSVERASPDRRAPTCPAFGRCGGCALGHAAADAQARWKEDDLRRRVAEARLAPELVAPIVASPRTLAYRNQSKLVVGRDPAGRIVVGAYARRSHALVDLAGCQLVEPPLQRLAALLPEAIAASGLPIYEEASRRGELRYVLLRSNARGEVLATLVTASREVKELDHLVKFLDDQPEIVGVVQSINPSPGNTLYGDHHVLRAGADRFVEEVADVALELSFRSFFQINRGIADAMWRRARALTAAQPLERVVDVYCGVGGFGLALARGRGGALVGIEAVEEAVADAAANAARAGQAARFVAGDAAAHLGSIRAEFGHVAADLVLLNPPRRGCDASVLEAAAGTGAPRLLYMSCNAATLVRDLALLDRLGYRVTRLEPFDMMPHTTHYEVLAVTERHGA